MTPPHLGSPAAGTISTYAGRGKNGYMGDGRQAKTAYLNFPRGISIDSTTGNVYFADSNNYVIRMVVKSTGIITTVAGTGRFGNTGDGGLATAALLQSPISVAVDPSTGNIYIADASDHTIRMIAKGTGIITTIVGTHSIKGYVGDGGLAVKATLNAPSTVVVDQGNGDLYIADTFNHAIRLITKSTGIVTTIAGIGAEGDIDDGGLAAAASLSYPEGVAVEAVTGNVYIADTGNHAIRMVAKSTGIITTIAGTGRNGYKGDGGAATLAVLDGPGAIIIDALSGNIYIADTRNHVIRMIMRSTGIITKVAGSLGGGYSGDGGPAISAKLLNPRSVALDLSSGMMYIADTGNSVVRNVVGTPSSSTPSTSPSAVPSSAITSIPTTAPTSTSFSPTAVQTSASLYPTATPSSAGEKNNVV